MGSNYLLSSCGILLLWVGCVQGGRCVLVGEVSWAFPGACLSMNSSGGGDFLETSLVPSPLSAYGDSESLAGLDKDNYHVGFFKKYVFIY